MKTRGWIVTGVVALLALLPFAIAYRADMAAAGWRSALADRAARLAAMRQDNDRLRHAIALLGQPSDEPLRRARAGLMEVQGHIATETHALVAASGAVAERFAAGSMVPTADWRNAGNATPEATLETALWAGAGGDVDALQRVIRLSPAARAAVTAALGGLSPDLREKLGSPEQFVAALTVPDIPLATVRVRAWDFRDPLQTQKWVQLEEYTGPDPKLVGLLFERDHSGWSLLVPDDVVANYLTRLKTGS